MTTLQFSYICGCVETPCVSCDIENETHAQFNGY